ncbi:MAG: CoA-binding protein [Elusimicrobiota bacterium]
MNFKEKIIAVVGVSSNPSKYGYKIFMDLSQNGYEVYGINPKLKSIEGKTIYPDLSSLPTKPDIVLMVVPPESGEKVIQECIKLKIEHIWFQPGSESENLINIAKENNIKTTTACFMVSNKIW